MKKLILFTMTALLGLTQVHAAEEEEVAAKSSAYISLGDPISADVLISDADAEYAIKPHVPAIRHSLIMLLSEQKAGDIKSPNKREEIRQQATARVKGLIADLSGSEDVSEVLFSSILVQ